MRQELDSLIGQLFITGLPGLEVDCDFEMHYSRCPSGGFILFGRNIHDSAQVRELTRALVDLATRHGQDLGPPLVAIDQEGGTLSPLKGLVPSLPGNMGLAATGDPGAARWAGYVTGRGLLSLGINVNLAPVLDLAREPLNPAVGPRSFGDDPRRVAQFGKAYANGILDAGIRFVAKHFPGHGSVSEDSHLSLPECGMSKDDLLAWDVVPFIEVGKLPQAAMMLAHVKFTGLDEDRPASLSYPLVTGFLRGELGFDGVVLTDCLEMGGAQAVGSVSEAAVMAIEAGCDIVLISHTPGLQEAAFQAVREAVLSGRLSLQRVEQSVARIRRWKHGLGQGARESSLLVVSSLASQRGYPDALGERVVSLVDGKTSSGPWAFGPGPLVLVTPATDQITPAEDSADISPLLQELDACGVKCMRVYCSIDPDLREIEDVISQVERCWRAMKRRSTIVPRLRCAVDRADAEAGIEPEGAGDSSGPGGLREASPHLGEAGAGLPRVALVVRNGGAARGQGALAAALERVSSLLLIGIRDPREVRSVQAALTRQAPALFTYSTESVVLSALARVLAGKASPKGVVPVRM